LTTDSRSAEPMPAAPSAAESTSDGPAERSTVSLEPSQPPPESYPVPASAPNEITPRQLHARSPKSHAVGKNQLASRPRSNRSPSDVLAKAPASGELLAPQRASSPEASPQFDEPTLASPPLQGQGSGLQSMPSQRWVQLPPLRPPPPRAHPPYVIWGPPVITDYWTALFAAPRAVAAC
jgi:hypothetical protein